MQSEDVKKVEYPEAPNRCQFIVSGQQCSYQALEGSRYCRLHDSGRQEKKLKKESVQNYRLSIWNDRVARFTQSTGIRSLREEIGILRMTLESMLNKYETESDLIINAHKVTYIVEKIEKVVSSANRLESSLGMLLDKQQVIQLAMEISTTISTYVKDEELLSAISDKIADSIDRIGSVLTDQQ